MLEIGQFSYLREVLFRYFGFIGSNSVDRLDKLALKKYAFCLGEVSVLLNSMVELASPLTDKNLSPVPPKSSMAICLVFSGT